MKKILSLALALALTIGLMAVPASADDKIDINLWSFTDEIQGMMETYLSMHPELLEKYNVLYTVINGGTEYMNAIDPALVNGDVDIYAAEAGSVYRYTKGAMSQYAAPYASLGIDISSGIAAAELAPYTVNTGTRSSDGSVVGLSYQSTGGAFLYRRSIAKAAFGTDDPAVVEQKIGAGTGKWDAFMNAAETLAANGYRILSGTDDMWNVIKKSAHTGWVVNNTLNIDPAYIAYMDTSRMMNENGYVNGSYSWTEEWFADMGTDSNVLGFFGPAWLLNYTIADNAPETSGDWAVCKPNVGFCWGGTWVLAGQGALNPAKRDFVRGFLEWVTLDTSETGLQYLWANGLTNSNGTKDTVASNVVMAKSNGKTPFLNGQDMFEVFIPANSYASSGSIGSADSVYEMYWTDAVNNYASGLLSKDCAILKFKLQVDAATEINVDFSGDSVVFLPEDLTTIEEEAMQGINAKMIVVPASVTSIGSRAFADASELALLAFEGYPQTLADDMLDGCQHVTIDAFSDSAAVDWAMEHGIEVITFRW